MDWEALKLHERAHSLLKLDDKELGDLLREYLEVAEDMGWEGFGQEDLTALDKFFADVLLYHEHKEPPK